MRANINSVVRAAIRYGKRRRAPAFTPLLKTQCFEDCTHRCDPLRTPFYQGNWLNPARVRAQLAGRKSRWRAKPQLPYQKEEHPAGPRRETVMQALLQWAAHCMASHDRELLAFHQDGDIAVWRVADGNGDEAWAREVCGADDRDVGVVLRNFVAVGPRIT